MKLIIWNNRWLLLSLSVYSRKVENGLLIRFRYIKLALQYVLRKIQRKNYFKCHFFTYGDLKKSRGVKSDEYGGCCNNSNFNWMIVTSLLVQSRAIVLINKADQKQILSETINVILFNVLWTYYWTILFNNK